MPAASQYQNVFRINKLDGANLSNSNQAYATKAKRNRQPLSCDFCRSRKLKCDRQSPCAPCSKRGESAASLCNYTKIAKDGSDTFGRPTPSTRSEAQIRLQKLEEMVTGLMQASSPSSSNDSSSNSVTVDQCMKDLSVSLQSSSNHPEPLPNGHLDPDGLERNYQGATHWTTILENIHDLRGCIDSTTEPGGEYPSDSLLESPDIVFSTARPPTLDDFLLALPDRLVVDRLVSMYFNSDILRAPHVHSQRFLREYQAFWADPSSASFLWLSMLFSIVWTSSYMESSDATPTSSYGMFLTKAAQALVAGDYQKSRPYSVDATLLYALSCYYLSREDANTDVWMIMGIATRLAVKMGYHRDPGRLAGLSPFEGEMRRRSFFLLNTFDVLLSIQYGLPAIIQEDECDAEQPRNLLDVDFDEDCKVLPSSRPITESTPMLYFCYKCRFAKAHKRAIRYALAVKTTSYDEILRLDAELHANDADVPPSLQLSSLDSLLLENPYQILRRMHIKFQYLISLCILHRKFLSEGRTNPTFAYSRATCTDAALQLLQHQADLYNTSQPGGRLQNNRSFLSTLTQHHFLLAAMIICLDMYESHNKDVLSSSKDLEAQATKYDALRRSHEIWMSRRGSSRDAQRASDTVANVLSRVPRPNVTGKTEGSIFSMSTRIRQTSGEGEVPDPVRNASVDSSWYTNPLTLRDQESQSVHDSAQLLDATDPLSLMFDGTENIDWDLLDQYLIEVSRGSGDSPDWQIVEPSEPTIAT